MHSRLEGWNSPVFSALLKQGPSAVSLILSLDKLELISFNNSRYWALCYVGEYFPKTVFNLDFKKKAEKKCHIFASKCARKS